MSFSEIYKITLVLLLIVCAVSVNLTRSLLRSVIIFMSYSSIMCLLWILMESPDLAITEAAVGAGVSGYLFLVTLKKLRQIEGMEDGQAEGGAWTDAAPDTDSAAAIQAAQTSASGGASVTRNSGAAAQASALRKSGASARSNGATSQASALRKSGAAARSNSAMSQTSARSNGASVKQANGGATAQAAARNGKRKRRRGKGKDGGL